MFLPANKNNENECKTTRVYIALNATLNIVSRKSLVSLPSSREISFPLEKQTNIDNSLIVEVVVGKTKRTAARGSS